MEISFKLHRRWVKPDKEESLMKRIARIVCDTDEGVFSKDTSFGGGYKWQLNSGNDWWAEIEDGVVKIKYRYGRDEFMKGLEAFLKWELGDD